MAATHRCYLCGEAIAAGAQTRDDALSMDHVPPKQFYPKEIRSTLHTKLRLAPTHKRCNEAYREDEEYFYHVMYAVVQGNTPSMGQAITRDLARRIHEPHTPAMIRRILKTFSSVTPGGIQLPPPILRFGIDAYRAQRVVLKIARGLFFLDHARYMPLENCKDIRLCVDEADVPEMYALTWQAGSPESVCADVFSYRHFLAERLHLWSMLFWQSLMFCTAFEDPALPQQRIDPGTSGTPCLTTAVTRGSVTELASEDPAAGVTRTLEVTSAEYVDGYKIHLRFNNGDQGVVDLKDALWGPMFEPLRDVRAFQRFKVSEVLHTLCWENDADFAPEFLHAKMVEQAEASDAAATRR